MQDTPHIAYRDGVLCLEGVALPDLAAAVGTPLYAYSATAMVTQYRRFVAALAGLDATVCYAVKANGNIAVIRTLADAGAGADVVSGGELARALAAGVSADRIVFAGVGKSDAELAQALDAGILQINVESEPELRALSRIAAARGREAPVSIRINPDIDAGTHDHITTGRKDNKFGIPWQRGHAIYDLAALLPAIAVIGISVHIGSQLSEIAPYEAAFARIVALARELRAAGQPIERIDFGGGLGISYHGEPVPSPEDYGAMVRRVVGDLPVRLLFEPGRYLVGNAGLLLARVIYDKREARRFVICDAAMNDLIRPMLYQAPHPVFAVRQGTQAEPSPADLVGPICESTDLMARDLPLAAADAGDLIAIGGAGAYGAVMSSMYNGRALVPEVLVNKDEFEIVRERVTIERQLAWERLPRWIAGAETSPRSRDVA